MHACAGGRIVRAAQRVDLRQAGTLLLWQRWCVGSGDCTENELPFLAQLRTTAKVGFRQPRQQLSWRNSGGAVGNRRCFVQGYLRAAAATQRTGGQPGLAAGEK